MAPAARPGAVLAVLSSAAFLATLDVFIVNVALKDIGREIGGSSSSLADLSWVLSAYAILYAALLVPAGRLADRFGRKGGFLLGLGLFTAASLGCALSDGLWVLVAFRCLQAAGAALLTPTSLGLLLTSTPPERRNRAVRIWAVSGSLAAASGPVVGGLLIGASWRWVFLINVPLGLAALVAAIRLIPASEPVEDRNLPDLAGGVLFATAISLLALGLVKAPEWGWGSGRRDRELAVGCGRVGSFRGEVRTSSRTGDRPRPCCATVRSPGRTSRRWSSRSSSPRTCSPWCCGCSRGGTTRRFAPGSLSLPAP